MWNIYAHILISSIELRTIEQSQSVSEIIYIIIIFGDF